MDISKWFNEDEKPLDRWVEAGGYGTIFRTIACIGDSLASGEFESLDEDNNKGYHDMYEFSWGQFMARGLGSKVYNFSRGGMSAKWYLDSFADERGLWNRDLAAQAYIFALGINDLCGQKQVIGTVDDIKDYKEKNTFAGYFGRLVEKYREIRPDAKYFFMTMPRGHADDKIAQAHRELMYQMAEHFPNAYVLDIYQYGPAYDQAFRDKFFMSGHMNPMGYAFTAQMVMSYLDYIVRHNMNDFKKLGFIGTNIKNVTVK